MSQNRLQLDHYQGCLLGGAIGDALGAPLEFLPLQDIYRLHGKAGIDSYVEKSDHIGRITDDTQMTLFTAEGLLRSFQRAQLRGIWGAYRELTYQSYLRWLHTQEVFIETGNNTNKDWILNLEFLYPEKDWILDHEFLHEVRAPGTTCLSSLRAGKPGKIDKPINNSKGCGGVMRMAPVGLLFFDNPSKAFNIGCELAALTHGHPSGYLTAGAFAAIISLLVVGKDLLEAIDECMSFLDRCSGSDETLNAIHKAVTLFKSSSIPTSDHIHQLGEGWVAEEALSIALFCSLHYFHDFKKGVLLAIHHNGDSDSTGAMTGNILGLINGISKLPPAWIDNLNLAELVSIVAGDLYDVAKKDSAFDWFDRYPPA